MPPLSSVPLRSDERRALLGLARHAILEAIRHGTIPNASAAAQGPLAEPGAAFVTLHVRGHLRGCVGRTDRDTPLTETVTQCAIGAALQDPRFAPLSEEEFEELEIEISILSPLEPIDAEKIEIGRHGLLIRRRGLRGLLLPQVAAQRHWTPQRFLQETCRKAGLGSHAWKEPGTDLFAFTTDVFSEADFRAGAYSNST